MRHVMLDLYGCDARLLEDEAHLRQVLDEYPEHIGMEKVGPVELRYIKTSNPLDDGHSGFVIIATSHVSLHAWPPYGMINIDIFSCNEFDEAEVLSYARAMFNPVDIEVHSVKRATRSPRPGLTLTCRRNKYDEDENGRDHGVFSQCSLFCHVLCGGEGGVESHRPAHLYLL